MLEYILQTTFLLGVLFIYMLSGSVIYSFVGEGYKATPLRCFAVGLAGWLVLVLASVVLLPINLQLLWWLYIVLTLVGLFLLPKKDQEETLDVRFFMQAIASCALLLPIFYFLNKDSLHFWQEFAIYGQGLNSLLNSSLISLADLESQFVYQLAILPVGYFTKLQDSVFACFNIAILAFVACEFVRNSGVKIIKGNIVFPLVVAFALLVLLNPFAVKELVLAADPFILVCAVGFAFAEYIYRSGFLPKSLAAIPPALILILLALSSIQGFLLGLSLFLVLSFRYLLQAKYLTHKQLIGYGLMLSIPLFTLLLWKNYLTSHSLGFLTFDVNKITIENIKLFYKAMFVLLKQHIVELLYIGAVFALAVYRFTKVTKLDDIIVDKYLLRTSFWLILIYVFICLPIFFTQYNYVARASYSLGFTAVSLIQFIILMPVGRVIKELLDRTEMPISNIFKLTIILALFISVFMNKSYFQKQQDYKLHNVEFVADYVNDNLPKESKIAVVDIEKMLSFYVSVMAYNNADKEIVGYNYKNLAEGFVENYKIFKENSIDYVLLHAPNNLIVEKFEYNFNPNFSYLYKVDSKGLILIKKFDNKFYTDTNMDVAI